jgi:hypothetical protein
MGALLDAVPAGGADHTEHHRDLATAVEAGQFEGPAGGNGAAGGSAYVQGGTGDEGTWSGATVEARGGSASAHGRVSIFTGNSDGTDGQVLTAQGDGTALWEAAAGGGTPGVDYPTSATVTLSSAQLLDLHNTPVTVVAAPGAGKYIDVHRRSAYYSYGTVVYAGTSVPSIAYDGQASGIGSLMGAIDATGDTISASSSASLDEAATVYVNKALVVMSDGATFTDGDGTLTVTVWYTIEDVP